MTRRNVDNREPLESPAGLLSFLGGGRVCVFFVREGLLSSPPFPPTHTTHITPHPTHRSHHPRQNRHTARHRVSQTQTKRRHRQEKEERWRRATNKDLDKRSAWPIALAWRRLQSDARPTHVWCGICTHLGRSRQLQALSSRNTRVSKDRAEIDCCSTSLDNWAAHARIWRSLTIMMKFHSVFFLWASSRWISVVFGVPQPSKLNLWAIWPSCEAPVAPPW